MRKQEEQSLSMEQEYDLAANTAARMLSRRPLSEAKLLEKLLEKKLSEDAASYAVERMRIIGALDDRAFGQMVVRSYRRKCCGIFKIRQELAQRGVPKPLADELLTDFEPDYDAMLALLEKKLHGDVTDRKANDKACAALQRRGFVFCEIRQAMQLYRESIEEEQT